MKKCCFMAQGPTLHGKYIKAKMVLTWDIAEMVLGGVGHILLKMLDTPMTTLMCHHGEVTPRLVKCLQQLFWLGTVLICFQIRDYADHLYVYQQLVQNQKFFMTRSLAWHTPEVFQPESMFCTNLTWRILVIWLPTRLNRIKWYVKRFVYKRLTSTVHKVGLYTVHLSWGLFNCNVN